MPGPSIGDWGGSVLELGRLEEPDASGSSAWCGWASVDRCFSMPDDDNDRKGDWGRLPPELLPDVEPRAVWIEASCLAGGNGSGASESGVPPVSLADQGGALALSDDGMEKWCALEKKDRSSLGWRARERPCVVCRV